MSSLITKSSFETQPFPLVMGTEEEVGLNGLTPYDDSATIASTVRNHLPFTLKDSDFTESSYRIYRDAGGQLEFATPETTSPDQLSAYIRGVEEYLKIGVGSYAIAQSTLLDRPITARLHRRVIDSGGTTRGCHDNFGGYYPELTSLQEHVLANYLVSRQFLTGAGYVGLNDWAYSQKMNGITGYSAQQIGSYLFSEKREEAKDKPFVRIETRCNDVNISEWAQQIRLGTTALFLAILQTPFVREVEKQSFFSEQNTIDRGKQINDLVVNGDGYLSPRKIHYEALDFMRYFLDFVTQELEDFVYDVPLKLKRIAIDASEACDDYRRILDGEEPISLLADRADWAKKFEIVTKHRERDLADGKPRAKCDAKERGVDLAYDAIIITASRGEIDKIVQGAGYIARDRDGFRYPGQYADPTQVMSQPPLNTRAKVRSELLLEYEVSLKTAGKWDRVVLKTLNPKEDLAIHLNPLESNLSEENRKLVEEKAVLKN